MAHIPLSVFSAVGEKFYDAFIYKDRWRYITDGFALTILITLVAVVIGTILGTIVALIKVAHTNNPKKFKISNAICNLYLTVIRGTPIMVQLLIVYSIVLLPFKGTSLNLYACFIAFGVNSGAYVAEIIRGGIQSIDHGQMEAGRSLGLSQRTTMIKIIFPQALKNVLPAIGNEFIALLKETAIAGYIGVQDMTKGGDIIRSITYDPYTSLLSIAAVYLLIVMLFTHLLTRLERRLRKGDQR
ncbi:amino acid ABC transporter permease [Scatolibacter rhodanostii]|uniref:amino acid ABC transporter permease n=1 Tax=Scatolibacter rhodanostii TaxID=2014781 RepID=UPI000C08C71C|nr:amino acid ABC transporter permease [Scatolibacter rhodanostii]